MDYECFPATEDSRRGTSVLVLMHGRGADRHDLAGLRPHFPGDWHIVLPDAPHPGAPWGYGPGRAWYRYLGEDRPDLESLHVSLGALDELVSSLPAVIGSAPSRLVIGGFSQGGTVGHGYAMTRPGSVQGVLNLSGFLPSNVPLTPAAVRGVRFFWGHGTGDPAIPFAFALRGRATLEAAGAALEAHDYEIGHWIDGQELADAAAWLDGI